MCPMPTAWARLHRLLGPDAPPPLILATWRTPALWKIVRLREQLECRNRQRVALYGNDSRPGCTPSTPRHPGYSSSLPTFSNAAPCVISKPSR